MCGSSKAGGVFRGKGGDEAQGVGAVARIAQDGPALQATEHQVAYDAAAVDVAAEMLKVEGF